MEYCFAVVVDDGMPGVVAPLKAYDVVGPFGQVIDDATFSLTTPLGADNGSYSHSSSLDSLGSWAPLW